MAMTKAIMDSIIKPWWCSFDNYFVECQHAVTYPELLTIMDRAASKWLTYLKDNKKYWGSEFSTFWHHSLMPLSALTNDIKRRMLFVSKRGPDVLPNDKEFSENPVLKFLCDSTQPRSRRCNIANHFVEFLHSLCLLEGISHTSDPDFVFAALVDLSHAGREFLPFLTKWPGTQEKLLLVETYKNKVERDMLRFQKLGIVIYVDLLLGLALSRDLYAGSLSGIREVSVSSKHGWKNFEHFLQFVAGEEQHPLESATNLPTQTRLKQLLRKVTFRTQIYARVDNEASWAKGTYYLILPDGQGVFLWLPNSTADYFPPTAPPEDLRFDPLYQSITLMNERGEPFYMENLYELQSLLKQCQQLLGIEAPRREKLLNILVSELREGHIQQVAGGLLGAYVIRLALGLDDRVGLELPQGVRDLLSIASGMFFVNIINRLLTPKERDELKDVIDGIRRAIGSDSERP